MSKRIRAPRGAYRIGKKPFCKHGHPLVEGNFKGTTRNCLTCHREQAARRNRAKGIPKRTNMLERGVCTNGHTLTAQTMRTGRHAGECAICHRIRTNGMQQRDVSAYCEIIIHDPCSYCGEPSEVFDHIVPRARGGLDRWDNVTASCRSCNAKKHAKSLLRFLCELPSDR